MTAAGRNRDERESVTQLLSAVRGGDKNALEQLYQKVEAELRRTAERLIRRERPGHSLQPTILIDEAFLRLLGKEEPPAFKDRIHFYRVAARTMRRLLIEHARRRKGKPERVEIPVENLGNFGFSVDHFALNEALKSLSERDSRQAEIIDLRYYCGLTIERTAEELDVSVSTVKQQARAAIAWLHWELTRDGDNK